jgi:hypothetical protein
MFIYYIKGAVKMGSAEARVVIITILFLVSLIADKLL